MRVFLGVALFYMLFISNALYALDIEWGEFDATFDNRVTLGAAWRCLLYTSPSPRD